MFGDADSRGGEDEACVRASLDVVTALGGALDASGAAGAVGTIAGPSGASA
jgi:hypothetical protein